MNPRVMSKEKLKEYADIITGDDSFYGEIMEAAKGLHRLFVNAGAVDAYAAQGEGTVSPGGKALSPEAAALCLFDLARTRKFSRGIIRAIRSILDIEKNAAVNVLYAGCGPYALLALLATNYFSASQLQFTLVDIHEESIESAKKIIAFFELEEYFPEIIIADATKLTVGEDQRPDILLTETMLNALRTEPQVSIAAHLMPFIKKGGLMVPERIEVYPAFVNAKTRNDLMFGLADETVSALELRYDTVADLDINTAAAANENIEHPFPDVEVVLQRELLKQAYEFELHTRIKVFDGEILENSDCGLTLPLSISNGEALQGKEKILFTYRNGFKPGFEWEIK